MQHRRALRERRELRCQVVVRAAALDERGALAFCLRLLVAITRRETALDRIEPFLHHRAPVLEGDTLGCHRPRGVERGACALHPRGRVGTGTFRVGGAPDGLLERAVRDGRRLAADAPRAATTQPVAVACEHDEIRMRESNLHRGAPPAVDQHRAGQQTPERTVEAGHGRAHAVDERPRALRHERRLRARRELFEHDEQPRGFPLLETLDRGRGRVTVDDDGAQGVTQRRGHRRLGAWLDVDHVEQRRDDARETLEVLDPCGGARRPETELERVGTCAPSGGFRFRVAPRALRVAEGSLGIVQRAAVGRG